MVIETFDDIFTLVILVLIICLIVLYFSKNVIFKVKNLYKSFYENKEGL